MRLDLQLDENDVRILRGALLAARATELGELHRRASRVSFGYGSESAREGMSAEVAHHQRRIDLLDRLLEALTSDD